jgi:hypothetical protein
MAGLIEELGAEYCNEMFAGALFLYEEQPHEFVQILRDGNGGWTVVASRYTKNPEKPAPRKVNVPGAFFENWGSLSHPMLGYRMAAEGRILGYCTKTLGTRRGLTAPAIQINFHDVCYASEEAGLVDVNHFAKASGKVPLVMCPTYLTFMEGMAKVMKKEIPSFAISADFAVAPNQEVDFLEILYRQRRIGLVDEKGNAELTVKGLTDSWQKANRGENGTE